MVEVGETEILLPVPTSVPPQDPENHWVLIAVEPALAAPPEAINVVEEPEHI